MRGRGRTILRLVVVAAFLVTAVTVARAQSALAAGAYAEISCASTTYCVEAENDGTVSTYANGTWSMPADETGATADARPSAVACEPGTTSCFVVFDGGTPWLDTDGSWSAENTGGNVQDVDGLSCGAVDSCMIMDLAGNTASWDGTAWTAQGQPPNFSNDEQFGDDWTGLSCLTSSFCVAIGNTDGTGTRIGEIYSVWNGTSWTERAFMGTTDNGTATVWCVATSDCTASVYTADQNEDFDGYEYDGSAWTLVSDREVAQASCGSSTLCEGVTGDGSGLESFDGVTWTTQTLPSDVMGVDQVSCVDASFCDATATDAAGDIVILTFDGTAWTEAATIGETPAGGTTGGGTTGTGGGSTGSTTGSGSAGGSVAPATNGTPGGTTGNGSASTSPAPGGTASSSEPATGTLPSDAKIKSALRGALKGLVSDSPKLQSLLVASSLSVGFSAPGAGKLKLSLSLPIKGRPHTVASGTASFSKVEKGKLKLRITNAGKRILRGSGASAIHLSESATFTPSHGTAVSVLGKLTVKR